MYSSSTQKNFWSFGSEEDLKQHRETAWKKYEDDSLQRPSTHQVLTLVEQQNIIDYYVCVVRDLCNIFQPPAPPTVFGTAAVYFKRFFLNTSPMQYHPKEVAYLCVYLATKVDEYNVSISQFMQQLATNYEEVRDFIITNELLLMQKLHFHLTIHNAFRPMEGFIIDMKSRFKEIKDIDKGRQNAELFIIKALHADTFFLYTPSQIALAALKASIGKYVVDYVQNVLGKYSDTSKLLLKLDLIIDMVKMYKIPPKDIVESILEKLEKCRCQEHNPLSEFYRANEIAEREKKERAKELQYEKTNSERINEKNISGIDMMVE